MGDVILELIEKEIMEFTYENKEIEKWKVIYKRTKNKRIKDKQWVKIFKASIKERLIIKTGEVVLLDIELFNELEERKRYLEEKLKTYDVGDENK